MSAPVQTHAADRIYYDAPQQLEFTATVTAIREVARLDGKQVWQLALDRTAFYPESGGQPFDTGTLTATARSGALLEAPITDVQEDAGGEVWHTTAKPLQEGTSVRGVVDAARRRDHMQQHSGQHLLSAVLHRDLLARTVSFHLGPEICTVDLQGGSLTEETLATAELAVNALVAQALPLSVHYATRDEAEQLLERGQLRKLPSRTGTMRLIEIPGIDLNACGGTHVATTAAIGPVLLRDTEHVRDTVRLQFVCGDRALRAARADFQLTTTLARSLSTGAGQLAVRVALLKAESRAAAKQIALLQHALAEAQARELARCAEATALYVYILDPQVPNSDAAYAKLLAAALVKAGVGAVLVAADEEDRCAVVLAGRTGGINCGALLRTALEHNGGRGGGSRELAQGSLPRDGFTAVVERLTTEVEVHAGTSAH